MKSTIYFSLLIILSSDTYAAVFPCNTNHKVLVFVRTTPAHILAADFLLAHNNHPPVLSSSESTSLSIINSSIAIDGFPLVKHLDLEENEMIQGITLKGRINLLYADWQRLEGSMILI